MDAERDAVTELIHRCARLPLALRIAAGRAATRPHLEIADLVEEMADDQGRWDTLSLSDDHETTIRTVFDWSYRQLAPEIARAFRRFGLHPGPEIGLHAAAAATGLQVDRTRRVLSLLGDAHLVEPISRDRYRLHDLLRAYAADRAAHDEHPDERDHARRTVLSWYAYNASVARLTFYPMLRTDSDSQSDLNRYVRPKITFTQPADVLTWFDIERVNLIAAARDADAYELPELTVRLALSAAPFLDWLGRRDEMLNVQQQGLAAARRIGDQRSEAIAQQQLGYVHGYAGRWDDATQSFEAALALTREMHNSDLEVGVLNDLGHLHVRQGRYTEAQEYLQAALPRSSGMQLGRTEGLILGNLSEACTGLSDYPQALQYAEHARSLREQAGDHSGVAIELVHMAIAYQGMGSHAAAITMCEQALSTEHLYPITAAVAMETLGASLLHTGYTTRATDFWREAYRIFDEYGDHRTTDIQRRLESLEAAAGNGASNTRNSNT